MKSEVFTPRLIFITCVIIVAVIIRLLPHWPNFTPVAAIALFGGTYITRKWLAFIIPLMIMFISDLIIGLHNYMIAVYAAFAITVAIGLILRLKTNILTVISAALISSILFFLITNFAVWYSSSFYAQDVNGLITCFAAGIPFFHYSVLGDLFYCTLLFGSFYLVQIKFPALQKI